MKYFKNLNPNTINPTLSKTKTYPIHLNKFTEPQENPLLKTSWRKTNESPRPNTSLDKPITQHQKNKPIQSLNWNQNITCQKNPLQSPNELHTSNPPQTKWTPNKITAQTKYLTKSNKRSIENTQNNNIKSTQNKTQQLIPRFTHNHQHNIIQRKRPIFSKEYPPPSIKETRSHHIQKNYWIKYKTPNKDQLKITKQRNCITLQYDISHHKRQTYISIDSAQKEKNVFKQQLPFFFKK